MMRVINSSRTLTINLLVTAFIVGVSVSSATAQSGSRVIIQSGTRVQSDTRAQSGTRVVEFALGGYCPVCILDLKNWVRGNSNFTLTYDAKVYAFPGQEQMEMFRADPAKYIPALGGDCPVSLMENGERVPGSLQVTAIRKGRLVMFQSSEHRDLFLADPAKYDNADLAIDGTCAVCLVELNQQVAGTAEFALYYKGMRYLFPGEEQRAKFMQDPEKYVGAISTDSGDTGSASRDDGG